MLLPIFYVLLQGREAGRERWLELWDVRIPGLLWNTLSLTFTVTAGTVVIGVITAFLVVRTDLPGRRWWRWILALPLVIPPYVGAMTYIMIFGPAGWMKEFWGFTPLPIFQFPGVALVMTLFTYPYVYLITASSLRKLNANLEEAALSQGCSYPGIFSQVVLPMLRPAIGAGSILVSLYVLSDFGAIAMLRYTTFTAAIYYQMGSFDRTGAAILSVVLILITLILLWLEWKTRSRIRFDQQQRTYRPPLRLSLGLWKWPALFFTSAVATAAVFLPLAILLRWTAQGIQTGALDTSFWGYTLNSLTTAGAAAVLSILLALPVIYLKARHPSWLTTAIDKAVYGGYALPGVIVALGIVFVFNRFFPAWYGTLVLLITAYVMRFLPQAAQAGEASLQLVSPRMEEASQSLGLPSWKTLLKVTLPLIGPGLLAGGALVFVSSMKELPATLLLRPAGYDTLAVRVWIQASEGLYHLAAPSALLLVLVSVIPLRWMMNKY